MFAFSSLLNVFLIIAFGAALRTIRIIAPDDWRGLERITYFVLFPATLMSTTATADLASTPFLAVGATLIASLMTIALLLLALQPLLARFFGLDGASFSSVFQGAIRWNSFVAFALSSALYGKQGAALCAVAIAAMIPLLNILSVAVITRYASTSRPSAVSFILTLLRNPFIWSCLIGLAARPVIAYVPNAILNPISMVGQISLVAGLLAVGSGLNLATLARPRFAHLLSGLLKLVAMPLLAVMFAAIFGVTGVPLAVTLIAMTVPTASASYLLAKQLGGNATLMAEILTLQTIAAMVSMPVLLSSIGPN
jgi:predicted permease